MVRIIVLLLLFCAGCVAYPGYYSGYPGMYGSADYIGNMRVLYYQQSLDRQELLMRQQNMILQQGRCR